MRIQWVVDIVLKCVLYFVIVVVVIFAAMTIVAHGQSKNVMFMTLVDVPITIACDSTYGTPTITRYDNSNSIVVSCEKIVYYFPIVAKE